MSGPSDRQEGNGMPDPTPSSPSEMEEGDDSTDSAKVSGVKTSTSASAGAGEVLSNGPRSGSTGDARERSSGRSSGDPVRRAPSGGQLKGNKTWKPVPVKPPKPNKTSKS